MYKFQLLFLLTLVSCSAKKGLNPRALYYVNNALEMHISSGSNKDSVNLAIKYLDSAISLEPKSVAIRMNKVTLLEICGKLDESIMESKNINSMYNENFYTLYITAILYRKNNNYDSGIHYYELALIGINENKTKGMQPIYVDYYRLKIYSRLHDSISFSKSLLDFKIKHKNENIFNDLVEVVQDTSKD